MLKYFQKLGKSLMIAVSILPAAAILMGIGYAVNRDIMTGMGADEAWQFSAALATFLIKAGESILANMPLLFAVSVGFGMTKEGDGAAALSGIVAYLVLTTILSVDSATVLRGGSLTQPQELAFANINNQFTGIISGLISSTMYNRFSKTELPEFLAFFSGKRLVPIVTSATMCLVALPLLFIWPAIYTVLVSFGELLINLGPLGAGIYGFFNRLLIPTGMHHALNTVFWHDIAGINDMTNFMQGTGTLGITGRYMAGFFPFMMFGLPGACLAMYQTAKPENKNQVKSLLFSSAVAAFFTGVTEPIEFSFMFVAPILYIVHCVLAGISLAIAAAFQWTAGFAFSGGFMDLFLSALNPMANKWYMLIVMGIFYFFIYFFVFKILIEKLDLKTPGREDVEVGAEGAVKVAANDWGAMATVFLANIGGKENVVELDNCATRLRITVKDSSVVNDGAIKSAGAVGVVKPSKEAVQIIVGPKVQFVKDEMQKML